MATYQELLATKAEIDAKAAQVAAELALALQGRRDDAILFIKEQMSELGITAADLGITAAPAKRKRTTAAAPGREHPSKGKPVAPKYRNQATGETWSGRGLQPKWLRKAIEAGANADDFAVSLAMAV